MSRWIWVPCVVLYLGLFLGVGIEDTWGLAAVGFAVLGAILVLAPVKVGTISRVTVQYGVVVPLIVFALTPVLLRFAYEDARPRSAFYEVPAQIIPVLLLALVLEARFLGAYADTASWLLAFVTVGLLTVGELYALVSISTGTYGVAPRVVPAALAAGLAGTSGLLADELAMDRVN